MEAKRDPSKRCHALVGASRDLRGLFPTQEAFVQFLGYISHTWATVAAWPCSRPRVRMICFSNARGQRTSE
jgi:hypothetical protein